MWWQVVLPDGLDLKQPVSKILAARLPGGSALFRLPLSVPQPGLPAKVIESFMLDSTDQDGNPALRDIRYGSGTAPP